METIHSFVTLPCFTVIPTASTVTKVHGLRACCADEMRWIKLLLMEV